MVLVGVLGKKYYPVEKEEQPGPGMEGDGIKSDLGWVVKKEEVGIWGVVRTSSLGFFSACTHLGR